MPTCVSDGEETSGLLFNKRTGGILQFTLTVFVFVVLNLYRSRIASVCATTRLTCIGWVEDEMRVRSYATMTAPALMLPVLADGLLSRWCRSLFFLAL